MIVLETILSEKLSQEMNEKIFRSQDPGW